MFLDVFTDCIRCRNSVGGLPGPLWRLVRCPEEQKERVRPVQKTFSIPDKSRAVPSPQPVEPFNAVVERFMNFRKSKLRFCSSLFVVLSIVRPSVRPSVRSLNNAQHCVRIYLKGVRRPACLPVCLTTGLSDAILARLDFRARKSMEGSHISQSGDDHFRISYATRL